MPLIKIPKKRKGEFRLIYVPSEEQRAELKELLPYLHELCYQFCNHSIVHGFVFGKSPVTCAQKHIGFKYTLNFDLEDFFFTVQKSHVSHIITDMMENPSEKLINYQAIPQIKEFVIDKLFIDGHCYQGLPTSPLVANLAAIKLDKDISNGLKSILDKYSYTRYADDLTISFNDYNKLSSIKDIVQLSVKNNNFVLNKRKTRLQSSKYGYRNVTGIHVGDDKIYLPRRVKRRIRALNYKVNKQKNDPDQQTKRDKYLAYKWSRQLKGLKEYAKLKMPHQSPFHIIDILYKFQEVVRITNLINHKCIFSLGDVFKHGSISAIPAILSSANKIKNSIGGDKHNLKRCIGEVFNSLNPNIKKKYIKPISEIITEERSNRE